MNSNVQKSSGGEQLAKVLWYYGLIEHVCQGNEHIICPFHNDPNPSMLVNLDNGSYFCFGCQASGDALKFVQQMENQRNGLNDLQGCKKYYEILKSDKCSCVSLPKNTKPPKSSKQLYAEAYDYYHGLSKVHWNKHTKNNEQQQIIQYMAKRGFDCNTLNKCGCKVNYNQSYGMIFPMRDNGKFRGWVCRTMLPEVEKRRKYLYNKGFRRRTTLVGDYANCDVVFVVEGYMDRLKFIQYGVDNVVAILGWKMSDIQYHKIKRANPNMVVVSALDNDKCGKKGSAYLEKLFGDNYVRFQYMKGIKDPGEMSKEQFNKMYRRTANKIKSKTGLSVSLN